MLRNTHRPSPANLQCCLHIGGYLLRSVFQRQLASLLSSVTQKALPDLSVTMSLHLQSREPPGHSLDHSLNRSLKSPGTTSSQLFTFTHACSFCLKSFLTFVPLLIFLQKSTRFSLAPEILLCPPAPTTSAWTLCLSRGLSHVGKASFCCNDWFLFPHAWLQDHLQNWGCPVHNENIEKKAGKMCHLGTKI